MTFDPLAGEWLQAYDAQVDVPKNLRSGYVPRRQGSHRGLKESRPVSENKEPQKVKFVYDFTEGNKDLKDLLGGKGANLAEMTNLGLPVPPGFTITTEACKVYLDSGEEPAALRDEVSKPSRPKWGRSSARPATRCSCPSVPAPSSPCPA
jgi:hypothetical protein